MGWYAGLDLFRFFGIILLMPVDPMDFRAQLRRQIPSLFRKLCNILLIPAGYDQKQRFILFIREMCDYIKNEGIAFESSAPYDTNKKIYYMFPYDYNENHDDYTDLFYTLYYGKNKPELIREFFNEQFIEEWFFMDAPRSQQLHILSRLLPEVSEFSAQTVLLDFKSRIENLGDLVWDSFDHFKDSEMEREYLAAIDSCRRFLLHRIQVDSWNMNAILYKIQHNLPLDEMDKTHPDLLKYRQILEEAAKKENNTTAKAVLRVLGKKGKIKSKDRDILL